MAEEKWLEPVVASYKKYFKEKTTRIIDVGSRDGDDAHWLFDNLDCEEDCQIICIEARIKAAKQIKKKYPTFKIFATAVSDYIGKSEFVSFNDPEFSGSSSILLSRAKAYASSSSIITVPVTRLDTIIEPGVIDILKIDVEGHSVPVLLGLGELLKDVLVAHIETETPERGAWGEASNNIEVMQIMQDSGFSLASVSYQWGWSIQDQVWVNTKHERYKDQ